MALFPPIRIQNNILEILNQKILQLTLFTNIISYLKSHFSNDFERNVF